MEEIRSEILKRASGVFLWVVLVVWILNTELDHGQRHRLREKLKNIPGKLDSLFTDLLSRDNENIAETTLCLQWLPFSKRPLKPEELYIAVLSGTDPSALNEWDSTDTGSNSDTVGKFILSCSKGLAEVSKAKDHTVQFIHETVHEFFHTRNGLARLQPDLKDNLDGPSEDRIKWCCYKCIMTRKVPDNYPASLPKANSPRAKSLRNRTCNNFPLLKYAVSNIFIHSDAAQRYQISQDTFLTKFKETGSSDFQRWIYFNNLFERYTVRRYKSTVTLLYIFSKKNLVSITKLLLSDTAYAIANVDVLGERYSTTIQAASANGHAEIIQHLLNANAVTNISGGEYHSPLIAAIKNGHETVVELVAQRGANHMTKDGKTPLSVAIEQGSNLSIVKLLLDNGADVNFSGRLYDNALEASSVKGNEAIVKLLLENGADVKTLEKSFGRALYTASSTGNEAMVKVLLASGGNVNTHEGEYGTALQAASFYANVEVVRLLLNSGADVDAHAGKYGNSLQAASVMGYRAIIKLLLESGADVNCQGGRYGNALQAASYFMNEWLVRLLLKVGAGVNSKGGEYGNALQAASSRGDKVIVKFLLANGADIDVQGGKYGTALQAASACGNEMTVKLLLENGANINAQGREYGTALQAASACGNEVLVKLLLENGADINAQGGKYGNVLQAAFSERHGDLLKFLLYYRAWRF
jgi:ankyrin repeat protein